MGEIGRQRPSHEPEATSEPKAAYGGSPTEREVLRVLWSSYGQQLVRSEIHKKMPQAHRPTLGRVGQILAALHEEGVVVRAERRSQGSNKAGFFALTPEGRELCHSLGFEHDERLLFTVPDDVLRTCLTRQRVTRPPEEPTGRIIAVWGYRGGLGRTTLVAHVARGLAKNVEGDGHLLVMDLDLGAPGLNDFFAPKGPGKCRGLGGLLVDFQRQPLRKRPLWLLGALSSPEYVLRPLEDVPNLVFLPSGLSPGQSALTSSERAEAMAMLRAEAADRNASSQEAAGFLSELRTVLGERLKFSRTLIDPELGCSLGAWIATQALADELVLCAKMTDDRPATLAGLQAVLASFLNEQGTRGSDGGCTFLVRLSEPTTADDLGRWIEDHLLVDASGTAAGSVRAEQLPYDVRLVEHPHRWENTHFFTPLIAKLERPRSKETTDVLSPELQALLAVLDPGTPDETRSMTTGMLENMPLRELARWADWYARDESLHIQTDAKGEELIGNIAWVHLERLRSKILGATRKAT